MSQRALVAPMAVWLVACGNPSDVGAEAAGLAEASASLPGEALAMRVPRAAHSAIPLKDDRVLLIGGCVKESCELGPDSSTVDVFDRKTLQFARVGNLLTPRVSTTTAALPDGRVFIAGGWAGSTVTDSTELFDHRIGRSTLGPDLTGPKADVAIVVLQDGRVLLAGGYDGRRAVGTIEAFDPRDNSLQNIGELTIARSGAGAAILPDGHVLIVGGGVNGTAGLQATRTAEIINPASGTTRMTGSMAEARYKHAIMRLNDGRVVVLGGSDESDARGKRDTIETYDPSAGTFAHSGRLRVKRYKIGNAVVLLDNGHVLVAGGAPRAEWYDPSSSEGGEMGPPFGGSLNFTTATLLSGGDVLVAGGYYEDGIRMNGSAWLLKTR